jgi:hypothetical protein
VPPAELVKGHPRARCRQRNGHVHQQLAGRQGGLVQALEEIIGGHFAPSAQRLQHHAGLEGHHARWQFGGGVGQADAAANASALPDGHVRDVGHGQAQQRQVLGDQRAVLDLGMARQGANVQVLTFDANVVQALNAVEVDQPAGLEQAKRQHGHEALPARDDAGVLPMRGQGLQCPVQGARCQVVKGGRFHACASARRGESRRIGRDADPAPVGDV